jgi:hypothetical protein
MKNKYIIRATNIQTLFPVSYEISGLQNLKIGDRVYLSNKNIKAGTYQIREIEKV